MKISTVITGVDISVLFQPHKVTVEIKFVSPHASSVAKEWGWGEGKREEGRVGKKVGD